jgi:hypothetical protein
MLGSPEAPTTATSEGTTTDSPLHFPKFSQITPTFSAEDCPFSAKLYQSLPIRRQIVAFSANYPDFRKFSKSSLQSILISDFNRRRLQFHQITPSSVQHSVQLSAEVADFTKVQPFSAYGSRPPFHQIHVNFNRRQAAIPPNHVNFNRRFCGFQPTIHPVDRPTLSRGPTPSRRSPPPL